MRIIHPADALPWHRPPPHLERYDTVQRAPAGFFAAAALALALLALAFVVAPRSCEGGLELYVGCGVASLLVFAALPFVGGIGRSLPVRIAWSAGFIVIAASAWLAGLFVANVRIMCRLFQRFRAMHRALRTDHAIAVQRTVAGGAGAPCRRLSGSCQP